MNGAITSTSHNIQYKNDSFKLTKIILLSDSGGRTLNYKLKETIWV